MFVLALAATGCATIFNRGNEAILLESQPPGAIVAMDGLPLGPAPQTVTMSVRETSRFDFRWDDGATATCVVGSVTAPSWYVIDVFTGVAGIVIDVLSGNAVKLDKHVCAVQHPGALA
jgi:hypothetical protein